MDDLHARKAEDGYLLLRRLVNRAKVQRVHPKFWRTCPSGRGCLARSQFWFPCLLKNCSRR